MDKNNPRPKSPRNILNLKYYLVPAETFGEVPVHLTEPFGHLVPERFVKYPIHLLFRFHFGLIQFIGLLVLPSCLNFDDILSVPLIKTNFVRRVRNIPQISHMPIKF